MTSRADRTLPVRVVTGLLPLAVVIAVIAGLTWFLLADGWATGPWLLALLLLAHGAVHLVFLFPQPAPAAATRGGLDYPFDMGRSWLITRVGLQQGRVRMVGIGAIAAVFIASLLAALATVNVLVPPDLWAGLVVAAAVLSMLLITLFLAPALLLGYAIDLALLWLAIGSGWSPATGAVG